MMRITVEIVPHGDESKAEVVGSVVVAQTSQLDDDPEGWRRYSVRQVGVALGSVVQHRRSDGAVALAGAALAALAPPSERSPGELRFALEALMVCHGPLGHWGRIDPPCAVYQNAKRVLEGET